MDKQERKKLRLQIGDLIANNCEGCQTVLEVKESIRAHFCIKECEIGVQIRNLGLILEPPPPPTDKKEPNHIPQLRRKVISLEDYQELKVQKKNDREIAAILGVSVPTLINRKNEWGIVRKFHSKRN